MSMQVFIARWLSPFGERESAYQRAAVAYFVYGAIYFFSALMQMTPSRQMDVAGVPWWIFFVLGGAVVVVFPCLVWRGYRWFTRILGIFPALKGIALILREWRSVSSDISVDPVSIFHAIVAFWATALLLSAGWGDRRDAQHPSNA